MAGEERFSMKATPNGLYTISWHQR